jgi:hypothetical protein
MSALKSSAAWLKLQEEEEGEWDEDEELDEDDEWDEE